MLTEVKGRMNVVIEGQVCIDRNILEGGEKFEGAGSPPMFIYKILKQLPGCEPLIIASYGPDYLPFLNGVNIYPTSPNSVSTLVYENNSVSGKRTQRAIKREMAISVPFDENVFDAYANADIIMIAPILPEPGVDRFVKISQSTSGKDVLKVLLPQGYFRGFDSDNRVIEREFSGAKSVLQNVDIVIVSKDDHIDMLSLARDWAYENKGLVSIVTLAERGAVAFHNQRKIEAPTQGIQKKDIVDSVGCGDTFGAAFAYKFRKLWGDDNAIENAMRFANEVAGQRLKQRADQLKIDLLLIQG